jgi:drug/metabolite transporter (DMT)-like permease
MINWIASAAISALTFAIGDFLVVKSQVEHLGAIPLFLSYTVLMGVIGAAILFLSRDYYETVAGFDSHHWIVILGVAVLFLVAYYTHFLALGQAPNPGYANALVMFHVALLSAISYFALGKPLNRETVFGIALMFAGSYFVIMYSRV